MAPRLLHSSVIKEQVKALKKEDALKSELTRETKLFTYQGKIVYRAIKTNKETWLASYRDALFSLV